MVIPRFLVPRFYLGMQSKALPYANINMRQSLINRIPCQRQGTRII